MTIGNRLAWLAISGVVIWAAWLSLNRVESGELFLFPLPFEPLRPYEHEVSDAVKTARQWTAPALGFLSIASLAVLVSVQMGPNEAIEFLRSRCRQLFDARYILCLLLHLACILDFASTAHYFRKFGITDEYHPGIKLVTYAWGRFIGCLIAKTIQSGLALLVCALFRTIARATLLVAIVAYSTAAVWNFWAS